MEIDCQFDNGAFIGMVKQDVYLLRIGVKSFIGIPLFSCIDEHDELQ